MALAKNETGCAILTPKAKVFARKAASEGFKKSKKETFLTQVFLV